MISELKDDDILDFLMNSDLEGDYSPEELKYLLLKWRYFYRSLHGKLSRSKDDNVCEISKLSDEVVGLKNQVTQLQIDSVSREEKILSLKNRKLSIKERFSGKIITKNEDQRV